MVHNTDFPVSLNEGALWAGRGTGVRITAGVAAHWGPVQFVLAPHHVREENADFQTFSFPEPVAAGGGNRERSVWANPFHYPPGSMDLPLRFGDEPRRRTTWGQSSLMIRAGPVEVGLASESQWWGPGVRNALLLGTQAPGFGHAVLRTRGPLDVRWGQIEGLWIVGRLNESAHFDFDPANDHRSLSAAALTFSPSVEPGLTVGVARAVYAPATRDEVPVGAALDVFRSVGRPSLIPGDSLVDPGPDQLFTLFARWVFPEAGFEAYGEWGRYEEPGGLTDFLSLPAHSRGYTAGLQFARPAGGDRWLRFHAEITTLEPSTSYRQRPFGEWYASRRVPQGYTHEGRSLGAAIGPSGSSQWLAADLFGERAGIGGFLGRIRWENQAQYTYFQEFRRSDVSLFGGVRGGTRMGPLRLGAEYSYTVRLNYLFQSQPVSPIEDRGVDLRNHTVRITVGGR